MPRFQSFDFQHGGVGAIVVNSMFVTSWPAAASVRNGQLRVKFACAWGKQF